MQNAKFDKNMYMALLSDQCQRYEEMIKSIEDMIKTRDKDISQNERNLLIIAYRNLINPKRLSLRTIMAYETKEKKKETSMYLPYIREYREKIENEITKICQNLIFTIDNDLLKKASETESKVFYIKIKGDFNRFMGEYAQGDLREKVIKDGLSSYQEAYNLAKELPTFNLIFLGLCLNYSIFYYEVLNEKPNAMKIANECIDKVNLNLHSVDQESDDFKKCLQIINLVQENLNMWKSEREEVKKD